MAESREKHEVKKTDRVQTDEVQTDRVQTDTIFGGYLLVRAADAGSHPF